MQYDAETMRPILFLCVFTAYCATLLGQPKTPTNYEESQVGNIELPALLRSASGKSVTNAKDWGKRREEIHGLLQQQMFGLGPVFAGKPAVKELGQGTTLQGRASWREQELCFADFCFAVLTVVPAKPHALAYQGRHPLFVGLNYKGNQAVLAEPSVRLTPKWQRPQPDGTVVNHRAVESSRGAEASRWPLETIIGAGFGVVTACYNEIYPDHAEGEPESIYRVAGVSRATNTKAGDKVTDRTNGNSREASAGQAIAAWAWGLSRMLDLADANPSLDAKRAVVIGHSRLGKTSLWAGANDRRFAGIVSNDSGEGGAALSRRNYGETIADLNRSFPHWFARFYREYTGRPEAMPFDAHFLLALAAPRPLYVASAEEDRWADPKGEFLGAWEAGVVYRLLGKQGLESAVPNGQQPPTDQPTHGGMVGYHVRHGKHDINQQDWEQYVKFFATRLPAAGR